MAKSRPLEPAVRLIMNATHDSFPEPARFELRFQSLFDQGRSYAFPCDASGRVDLDALGTTLRTNYLYARTLIGRDFATPAVLPRTLQ
jgi:hypothetical protein